MSLCLKRARLFLRNGDLFEKNIKKWADLCGDLKKHQVCPGIILGRKDFN